MRPSILFALTLLTPAVAQESSWLTDFEAAKAAAAKDKKVILANFTGSDWCGWCIKLKDEVFSKPEFQEWAAKKVVLLELDYPRKTPIADELKAQNQELAQRYGIRGYPTILFLDAKGEQIGKSGYLPGGPAAWTKDADAKLAKSGDGGGETWSTDFEAAMAKAKKEKKLILANFTGSDWCGWCIKLKDEVFSKPEFQEWAAANVVLVELDYPKGKKLDEKTQKQNEKLAREYQIQGYPTILFLDAKGKQVADFGYHEGGPAAWIAEAEKRAGIKPKGKKKGK